MEKFLKENWFKVSVIFILLIVGLSAVYYFSIFLPTQQRNLLERQTKNNLGNTLDLQAKCADRSAWFFKQGGYDKTSQRDEINSYTNHWNQQMNKCFILIYSSWSADINKIFTLFADKTFFDAFEGKLYGEFTSNGPGWFEGERKIMTCAINKDGNGLDMNNGNQPCKSETEFDNFVSSYMNN